VRDMATGKSIVRVFEAEAGSVHLGTRRFPQTITFCSTSGVHVLDARSGQQIGFVSNKRWVGDEHLLAEISLPRFTVDDYRIVLTGTNNTVNVWDISTWKLMTTVSLGGVYPWGLSAGTDRVVISTQGRNTARFLELPLVG